MEHPVVSSEAKISYYGSCKWLLPLSTFSDAATGCFNIKLSKVNGCRTETGIFDHMLVKPKCV